ncbi:polyprenyl synthetase family protein [Streptomyces sp. NPDC096205]|uniref:polyprenyl synthetase family protein n=1 Tax=Streptomyces sp. NPDC096205 TaxID=3366081 RepID=UPI003819AAAE
MSSQEDLRALFRLDEPRFVGCYDPANRRTADFVDGCLALPDGSDARRVTPPAENLTAERFHLYGALDLGALRQEVDGPYREVHDHLAAIPLFGYNGSAFNGKHNEAWAEHLMRSLWSLSWQHHYGAALVIHFYRRITPPEYQSAAHMRLVYAVAAAADWLTTATIVMDDWMDGARLRNGHAAWHLQHPRSFANDGVIVVAKTLNVLSAVVPDRHPFKREMRDRAVRQVAHFANYFAYHSMMDLRRAEASSGGAGHSPLTVDDITADDYQSVVFNRATDWIHFLVDMSRLLAGYGAHLTDGEVFMDYVAGASTVGCVVDDIVDASTGEDLRCGETTIQLILAVERAEGRLGPIAAEDAADILRTLRDHVGVDTDTDAEAVRRMYVRHGIPELTLDYLEAVLNRVPQLRRAAMEECGAPGDLPAFMLHWLAIDRGGNTERAQESGELLGQERFRDLLTQLTHADEGQATLV